MCVSGFVTSAAKTLYQMELNISVLSVSNEDVALENGFREHVVFNIIAKKIVDAMDESTPTFVAQTQKNSERQILKDVSDKYEWVKESSSLACLQHNDLFGVHVLVCLFVSRLSVCLLAVCPSSIRFLLDNMNSLFSYVN